MDQAALPLIALGAVVWLAIFGAAKLSARKTAGLRTAARNEAMESLFEAQIAHVGAEEERQPPLPTLSLYEALKRQAATFKVNRDDQGRFTTSSSASYVRQRPAERERA